MIRKPDLSQRKVIPCGEAEISVADGEPHLRKLGLDRVGRTIGGGVVDDVDMKRNIRIAINAFKQSARERILVVYGNDDVCGAF
jgi:hypothetical protein